MNTHKNISFGVIGFFVVAIIFIFLKNNSFYTINPQRQIGAISGAGSGLVAHYSFDEGSGNTVLDKSGLGNNATVGTGSVLTSGKVGSGAITFSTTTARLQPSQQVIGLGDVSICFWLYPQSEPARGYLVSNAKFTIYFSTLNRIVLSSASPGGEVSSTMKSIQSGTWSHACVTRGSDGAATIYINGVRNVSGNTLPPVEGTASLSIGNHAFTNNAFIGSLDDVRIYNRVLSASEVSDVYSFTGIENQPLLSPTTTPLVENKDPVPPSAPTTTNPSTAVDPIRVGKTVLAASCSQGDVQVSINSAQDGDTVLVPPGTCTWSQTVSVHLKNPLRSLVLRGGGVGKTIIVDSVPVVNTAAPLLRITTSDSKSFRLTGFTFETAPDNVSTSYSGKIALQGESKSLRIDGNHFNIRGDRAINLNGLHFGVIDGNLFEGNGQAITVHHSSWGGKSWGDGSWAAPLSLGSDQALFVERNTFKNRVLIDAFNGARYVVRNNIIQTTGIPVQNHGTESSGRARGVFSWEVYNNTATLSPANTFFHMRGGTGVIFNNTITGSSYLQSLGSFNNYRSNDWYAPYGSCDGSSSFDKNSGVVYATGSHTGSGVTNGVLVTSDKQWVAGEWIGYSLRNKTKGWGAVISANTENTISVQASAFRGSRNWDTGDVYEVLQVEACLDQIGRSTGALISGGEKSPLPAEWPKQSLEPVYLWDNTLNNLSNNKVSTAHYTIKKDREYYEGKRRPGYVPYPYPHPLTQSGFTSENQSSAFVPPVVVSAPPTPQVVINPVSGVCSPHRNTCLSGSVRDDVDSSTHELWSCIGRDGGATASCSFALPTISSPLNDPSVTSNPVPVSNTKPPSPVTTQTNDPVISSVVPPVGSNTSVVENVSASNILRVSEGSTKNTVSVQSSPRRSSSGSTGLRQAVSAPQNQKVTTQKSTTTPIVSFASTTPRLEGITSDSSLSSDVFTILRYLYLRISSGLLQIVR